MNLGELPTSLTKLQLMKCSREDLLRLARWEGLRYDLDDMSKRQLAKLIRWKLTRNRKYMF